MFDVMTSFRSCRFLLPVNGFAGNILFNSCVFCNVTVKLY